MSNIPATDCWFLTGPTASGKTEVGVELAEQLDAEIVSLDSMALYREMDIGTAKPTLDERSRVPHHLLDLLEPHEDFSLAQYVEAADEAIESIRGRGSPPLFVGGTPLYLKSLLRGIFQGPKPDIDFRRQLELEARSGKPGLLHARLVTIDPIAAERLHPNDTRRLIRAIEVFEKTGQPISQLQQQFERGLPPDRCRVFVLDRSKEELHQRIEQRVHAMFELGLVDEVRGLIARSKQPGKTARQAIGYREVIEHLQGMRNLDETIDQVILHTRQFAKRQRTWFRSLSECRFETISGEYDVGELAARIAKRGEKIG